MATSITVNGRTHSVDRQHETSSHPQSTRPGGRRQQQSARRLAYCEPRADGRSNNRRATRGRGRPQSRSLYVFSNQRVILHYLSEMPLLTSALRTLESRAGLTH